MYNQWGPGMHNLPVGARAPDWVLALFAFLGPLIIIVVLWSLFWKGLALWHSARRNHPWWFVAILVINTAGILEIIYLFGIIKLSVNQLFSRHVPHEH